MKYIISVDLWLTAGIGQLAHISMQLAMQLPISATIYDLKSELERHLNVQSGMLKISASGVTLAESDLVTEVSGLRDKKRRKPVLSCYNGNNMVGLILFSLKTEDVAVPLVDDQVSDSSVIDLSSGSSSESTYDCKRDLKRKGDTRENPTPFKKFKNNVEFSEESIPSTSSDGAMIEACGMGGCEVKSRPQQVESESELQMEENGLRPPYMDILPENRQFVLVVTTSGCPKDYCHLLEDFFAIFQDYRSVASLSFNEVAPVTQFNGRLFVAAANEDTMEWVERNICSMEQYEVTSLIQFLRLTAARVTWPKVKCSLKLIFKLLESQNCNISTDKWAVVSRNLPPSSSENITDICDNEQLEIWMDAESADAIKERCNLLKYNFFNIEFEFCD
ncbi:uncharacterized protein [Drosophila tropicalis]|uniref:uncharacterized protein n=1 Tax=Drosophila tropicalis TaxID=46794 RepID=UPI0035ABE575